MHYLSIIHSSIIIPSAKHTTQLNQSSFIISSTYVSSFPPDTHLSAHSKVFLSSYIFLSVLSDVFQLCLCQSASKPFKTKI